MEDIGLASAPTHGAVTLRGRSLLSFHHSPQSSHGPTELRTSPAIQPRPQKLPSRGVPAATGRLPPTTGPVPTTPRTVPTTPRTVPTPRTSVWQPAIPATTHRRCCYKSTTGRGRHRKLPQLQDRLHDGSLRVLCHLSRHFLLPHRHPLLSGDEPETVHSLWSHVLAIAARGTFDASTLDSLWATHQIATAAGCSRTLRR